MNKLLALIALTFAGCGGDGSTPAPRDDTAAVQAMIDAGGVVTFPPGQYTITKTLVVSKSETIIEGVGAVFNFKPKTPSTDCFNDAVFSTPCIDYTPRQQILSSIALGGTSFTAVGDLTSLAPGDWLVLTERDNKYGNIVAYDWAQVESVAGQVVTTVTPFRTAFSSAQPFISDVSGLGFIQLPALTENVEFRNIAINSQNAVAIQVDRALNTTIEGVTANATDAQPFYSFQSKGLIVRGSSGIGGRLNEFAATVDVQLTGNLFSSTQGAGVGLDLGSAFFTVSGNSVPTSINIGMYLFIGVHDGVVENNQVAYVNGTPDYNTVGFLGTGAYDCTIINNYFAGGAGEHSTGLVIQPDDNEAVPIPSVDNVTAPNTFGPEWGADYGGR